MGKILHRHNEYIVIEENNRRGCVLVNSAGKYSNHGHLKKLSTALMMISLIERRIVPKSDYLRCTALRVATDEDYRQAILNKIEKQRNKQKFINERRMV